ncbi:hypothetical protein HG530_012818 [Fusarium avenaceum]|nr:hypothetical protein HG530_012818 [Fusarium avenaceum]
MARAVGHKSVVEETDLHQVLADGTRLNVIVVRLRDSAEEVHRVGVAKIVVECAKDESLSAEDLSFTETVVGDALEVLDVRRKDLLLDDLLGQEAVNNINGEEKGLREEMKACVDLNEPVNQNTTSLPLEVVLVLEDFVGILGNHKRVLKILAVEILDTRRLSVGGVPKNLSLVDSPRAGLGLGVGWLGTKSRSCGGSRSLLLNTGGLGSLGDEALCLLSSETISLSNIADIAQRSAFPRVSSGGTVDCGLLRLEGSLSRQ